MLKYFLPIIIFISFQTIAQNYEIKVELKAAANQKVSLANYYISNIYAKDTVLLDNNGVGVFKADSLLPQGLYKIYLDDKNHFDFLLGADQQFTLTNSTFKVADLGVKGAVETEEFIKYVEFLDELKRESANLRRKMDVANEEEKAKLQDQMAELTPKLHNYWKNINQKYPTTFLAKFLLSNLVESLEISTLPKNVQENDSLLLRARFDYQKAHYWDNFDYTDERFLYTPLLKPKLETWYTKVLYPDYDSVKVAVMEMIEKVRPNKRIFQFVTSWFLNESINSNIMGMDALFVDIAKKYYFTGQAFWASEETLEKIRENVLFAEKNLIGMTAPDLNLESYDGEFFRLSQIDAKYTGVLIFEPNCSHCKEFVPDLYKNVYQKYKDKGFEVFAIYSMDDKEEWGEFLAKHNLFDWINVWDEHHVSRFKILYDARKTPGIYILDENKTIVTKKMTVEQIDRFLGKNL
jgi:peroxiredoxin